MKQLLLLVLMVLIRPVLHAQANEQPAGVDDTVVVYVFLLEDCVISQHYTTTLNRLYDTYGSGQLRFEGIFPNRFSNPDKMAAYAEKYGVAFPLKLDYYQTLTKAMGATVTPEVVVYSKQQEKILYRGRIDDQYAAVGRRKPRRSTNELEQVLEAIHQHESVDVAFAPAVGCFINFVKE